jgi:hypothetical protein
LLIIISKWEHVMYHHHQGYNESIKAKIHLLSKKNFFISNCNLKKFNKKFKIYKKIDLAFMCVVPNLTPS